MTSLLFRHIEQLQHALPATSRSWGGFLDAGTGVNSSLWSTALETRRWVAVTAARAHAAQVHDAVGERLRPQDRLIVGDWTDPGLLEGEVFDTVLADYLLGAVEGFAPYFQPRLFARLKPLVGRRLYVVGLDPYVAGPAPETEAGRAVRDIGRLRDACLTLADETPYREYPMEWTLDALAAAGFRIVSARRFANRYRETWVHGQLDMAARRLERIPDPGLAAALAGRIERLRADAAAVCRREDGLRCGADYVIACEPEG